MKHKKSKIIAISLGLLGVVLLAGLLLYSAFGMKKRPYRIVLIPKIVDETNDFWTSLIGGAQMGAQEYDVELQMKAGDSEYDYEGQNEAIEEAIKEKPDAILLSPCSYTESNEQIRKIKEAGIPLGLIDSLAEESLEDFSVATDNVSAGRKLGEFAASRLEEEEPCIGIVGHVPESSTAIDREIGVRQGLGKYEPYVKEVVFCDSVYEKAYKQAVQLMESYPDLNVLIGLNEYSAVGMARAVRDAEKKEDIIVVGFDSSIEEIQLMEEKVFRGIVIQKPFNMGYLGVEQAVKLLDGDRIEDSLDSGSELITMENLYTEENQKLLFPFVE